MNTHPPEIFSTRRLQLAAVFSAGLLLAAVNQAKAIVYDAARDLLTMELSSATGVNPNGAWIYGGYNALPGNFTPYTAAEHLANWGSGLPDINFEVQQ